MLPLSACRYGHRLCRRKRYALPTTALACLLLGQLPLFTGCGGGSAAPAPVAPPPAPAPVVVTVSPASAPVLLGNAQPFSANVSNAADARVSWAVNGVPGGSAALGTISADGTFTAPRDLPSPATLTITATSIADTSKSATAQVTVASDIGISVTPGAANVELGATLGLGAVIASAGHPDTSVLWTLSGAACPNACGAIDANGNYTAPQTLPPAASFAVIATSAADRTKQAVASLTVTSSFTLQLAAPSSVAPGGSATLIATLAPLPGSNPNPQLVWSLSGSGCSGPSCGLLSTTTQAGGSGASPDAATFTAPSIAPNPNTVTVTVTPQADPSKKTQAVLAISSLGSINLSPSNATLAINHRLTLAAQLSSATSTTISWSVNGISGGNTAVGQICAANSNPCAPAGTSTQVDYLAPGAIPSPNPVTVLAANAADATQFATSQITVINHVLVSVQPQNVTLAPGASQPFTASVLGTANQNVIWQIQGAACVSPGICGVIGVNGVYTAPASAPSPANLQIVAVSSDDSSQFGTGNVSILGGPNIQSLHPASVYAGAANGFTLRVDGSGFASSNPGPGSSLLVGGSPRTTNCVTAAECSAQIFAADVAAPASLTLQIRNPDGATSNGVALVIAPPNTSDRAITLTATAPESDASDIVVVEPSTAGIDAPGSSVDLNVGALGIFSTATNSCSLAGNPIPIARPAAGAVTVDICVFSQSGLDTGMTYTVSGPGDISVIARQPAGLGIIHLTLQVAAGAQPGARTLFIQNTNLDKTAATGALEVQ